jgi:hypothetical protein
VLELPVAKPLVPLMPLRMRRSLLPPGTEVGEWEGVGHFLAVVGEEVRRFRDPGGLPSPAGMQLPVLEPLPFALAGEAGLKQLHPPLSPEQWAQAVAEGTPAAEARVRVHLYAHGMQPALRRTVWPYLLDVLAWSDTPAQREAKLAHVATTYYHQVQAWHVLLAQTDEESGTSFRRRSTSNAGDEAEGGDPVDKLKERIYRIGGCGCCCLPACLFAGVSL